MKRTIAFAIPCLDGLREYRRWIYTALVLLFMLITSVSLVNAQSKDRGKPTLLTSNVISGRIEPDNTGDVYYYSFVAGPGDLIIKLSIEATRQSVVSLGFDLSRGSRIISSGGAIAHRAKPTDEQEIHVNLTQRQLLILTIRLDSGSPGKYRFEFGGALDVGKDRSSSSDRTTSAADRTDFSEAIAAKDIALPKEGSLTIRLPERAKLSIVEDDGSIKEFDLSKVVGILVVNEKGRTVLSLRVPRE